MMRTATLLFGLAVAVPVHAADAVWRSPSDVLPSPVTSMPTIPMPPEAPASFVVSIAGKAAVASGAALDLRPVVNGASGRTSFLLFGRLPPDATFDAATGRIGGQVLEAGSNQIWVSATDSTGATVTAGITIVAT